MTFANQDGLAPSLVPSIIVAGRAFEGLGIISEKLLSTVIPGVASKIMDSVCKWHSISQDFPGLAVIGDSGQHWPLLRVDKKLSFVAC